MELVRVPKHWATFLDKSGYRLVECVGTGSFGDVFSVIKKSTGQKWAMKRLVVRTNIAGDKYAMAEIQALMELDHPNIIALEEILLVKRMACIVMELAPNGNLEMLWGHHGPDLEETFIRTVFNQVLSAVEFCHGLDLAHRDLNPSNILIFNDSCVKLADFGLCFRCVDVSTGDVLLCSDFLGQDSYLAPEVRKRQPFLAKPADVWSLGCVLYFMTRGSNPAVDENDVLTFLKDLIHEVELRHNENSFTSFTLTIIEKACNDSPTERLNVSEMLLMWGT